jgi:hypothetical protein
MMHTVALHVPILGGEVRDLELQQMVQQGASVTFSDMHIVNWGIHPSTFFFILLLYRDS